VKEEFENRDSRSLKGEIDLVRWFGGPHATWSLRLRSVHGWRKEGGKGRLIEAIDRRNLSETTRSTIMLDYGARTCLGLNFRMWATNKTTVSPKAYVELYSELWREKRVSLKLPMDTPAIAWSREAHHPRSYRRKQKELALARPRNRSAFRIGVWSPLVVT
jgi:hypothetical protein